MKKEITMKRQLFYLGMIAAVLLSCGGNGAGDRVSNEVGADTSNSADESTEADLFDRETFDRERQLWLAQGIEDYVFSQVCSYPSYGSEPTYQYIKNGKAAYFQKQEGYIKDSVEVSEKSEDGSTSGYGSAEFGYRPGKELYTTKGRRQKLIDEIFLYMSIDITSIYTQTDDLAKGGKYKIDIRYDGSSHYPSYLKCVTAEGKRVFTLELRDLVVNPEIPDESSAQDPYPELEEDPGNT